MKKKNYDYEKMKAKYHFQPTRTLFFSLIFTIIVMWQVTQHGFSWWYFLPAWLFIWALFTLAHWIYNRANIWLIDLSKKNHEKLDAMEAEEKRKKNQRRKSK